MKPSKKRGPGRPPTGRRANLTLTANESTVNELRRLANQYPLLSLSQISAMAVEAGLPMLQATLANEIHQPLLRLVGRPPLEPYKNGRVMTAPPSNKVVWGAISATRISLKQKKIA